MTTQSTPSEAHSELQAVYQRIELAFLRKDLDAVAAHISDRFKGEPTVGPPVDKPTLLDHVRVQFDSLEVKSWKRTIERLEPAGDQYVVIAAGNYFARDHNGVHVTKFLKNEDTWEKEDGVWRVVVSKALEGDLS